MRPLLLGFVLLFLVTPPVTAQAEMVLPSLEFTGTVPGRVPIGSANGSTDLVVNWTFAFPGTAASPGGTTITWALDRCGDLVHFAMPVETPVTYEAGQTSVSGTALLPLQASAEAPGLKTIGCELIGHAVASPTTLEATGTATIEATVAYRGELVARIETASKLAGPQKIVRYNFDLENLGNARSIVKFDVLDRPSGKRWNVLLPDNQILDSPTSGGEGKTTSTAVVAVATPYHNGYVKDDGRYVVRVTVSSADQPDQVGSSQEFVLNTGVKGWYVPGPSPLLLVAGLVALACVRRR